MNKIIPHLWFDKEAKEASDFYVSVFSETMKNTLSQITGMNTIRNTPSGDCDIVSFNLLGYPFKAISAGPFFTFNPSVSFMINFDPSQDMNAEVQIESMWQKLSNAGKILMPLDAYPFSKRYGWVQDKYGLSWQLILTNPDGEYRPPIIPTLLFVKDVCGKAEEASNFYLSIFKPSKRGRIDRYAAGMEPDKEGSVMFTDFMISNQWFAAMDSAQNHKFSFNEAVSFIVYCADQQEINHYWEKLSAVPESEQCGWLKDKYGISWQIVPQDLDEMMSKGSAAQINRVTQAFLAMKKFDIESLRKAYETHS